MKIIEHAAAAALLALLPLIAGACGALGAVPAATTALQGGVAAVGYTAIQAGQNKADRHTPGDIDDQEERCDALVGAAPGVEEIRKDKDDTIESRQWKIANPAKPHWIMVPGKNAGENGWEPRPNLAKRNFNPPLADELDYKKSMFIAYAPNDLDDIDDTRQMTSETEAFGEPHGSFEWRGKTYGYSLVKQLPCFPVDEVPK